MNDYNYCSEVESILLTSGWYKGRVVDIEPYSEVLKKYAYSVLDSAISFLSEYGNLKIVFVNKRNGKSDDITFDVKDAAEIEAAESINSDFLPRIRSSYPDVINLCPIGTAYDDYFVLMMDEKGGVYGTYGNYLVRIADSGEAAIEKMIGTEGFYDEIPE